MRLVENSVSRSNYELEIDLYWATSNDRGREPATQPELINIQNST